MIDRVTDKVIDKEQALLDLLTENPSYTFLQLVDRLGVIRKTVATRLKRGKN